MKVLDLRHEGGVMDILHLPWQVTGHRRPALPWSRPKPHQLDSPRAADMEEVEGPEDSRR